MKKHDESDAFIKMMFGEHAVHVPLNLIFQNSEKLASGVFQAQFTDGYKTLLKNASDTHILMLADAVIRPRAIIESHHMRGAGIGNLYTSGFADINEWVREGRIVHDLLSGL